MPDDAPNLADLKHAASVFNGFANVDTSWLRLLETVKPGLDLSRADHRALLLRWLNSWGCRIRYPRDGEPAPFDTGAAAWWVQWRDRLPSVSLSRLSDDDIDAIGAAYAALAALDVSAGPRAKRTLGPTAAAKAMYALRPDAIMPWDAAIAERLYGARDGVAFAEHQRRGRRWASLIAAEAATAEDELPALVGRPTISLAKLLDEYLYVTVTMSGRGDRTGEG